MKLHPISYSRFERAFDQELLELLMSQWDTVSDLIVKNVRSHNVAFTLEVKSLKSLIHKIKNIL